MRFFAIYHESSVDELKPRFLVRRRGKERAYGRPDGRPVYDYSPVIQPSIPGCLSIRGFRGG
eukprot:4956924-Pleurochrysis_carterae.AAC.1